LFSVCKTEIVVGSRFASCIALFAFLLLLHPILFLLRYFSTCVNNRAALLQLVLYYMYPKQKYRLWYRQPNRSSLMAAPLRAMLPATSNVVAT
jgi:hypothetical protein